MHHPIGSKDIRSYNNSIIRLHRPRPKSRQFQLRSIQRLNTLASEVFLEINTRRDDVVPQSVDKLKECSVWLAS